MSAPCGNPYRAPRLDPVQLSQGDAATRFSLAPRQASGSTALGRRLISTQPQAHRGELDHGEEVGSELVVAVGDTAEVLLLGEEPLNQVALAVEPLAEAGLPAPVALGRDVGRGALLLDQIADTVGVVGLVGQHDGARAKVIE